MIPLLLILASTPGPSGIAFFEEKIRPVLAEHCYACHSAGAKKLKGNLYLDSKAGWEKGGDHGEPVIVPGDPAKSLLVRTLRHLEADLEMPPNKPKLPEAVIADFVTWIRMGAPDPRDGAVIEAKRADKAWWSLQPLAGGFAHGSIDGFVEEKLAAQKLAMNPAADPRALIRRMTYDLTGLPPSAAETGAFVAAFAADRDRAVAALVDRLLASPRYGEHWGRHWLDVVRFGESNGFERNFIIDDLWPFRDYVIRSFNEDKPFDRFIIEHLAGDVIGKDDPDVEVGSSFLVAGPYDDVGNQDVVAQKNIRAATLDDMITATSGAFLGLTINCARCHNHKFDPIPTEDYYRIRAAFEGVRHGRRILASKEQRQSHEAAAKPLRERIAKLTAERDALNGALERRAREVLARRVFPRPKVDPVGTEERFAPVAARQVRFVVESATDLRGGGRLTEFEVWSGDRNVALAAAGAKAEGARGAVAEDFPDAYGPQFCIDGEPGEQWFIGSPAVLTITLAKEEVIDRIVFRNVKGKDLKDKSQGGTPCEYEVRVSRDGKSWKSVASGEDRKPWSPAHGIERVRPGVILQEDSLRLAELDRQIAEWQGRLNRVPPLPMVWAGNFADPPEPTQVHKGGDPMKPLAVVAPASLSVLEQGIRPYALDPRAPEGERRLALARWIASSENALTARVLVNRVWQYHFGTGIVETPGDFGFLGGRPSHPELLDFLARRLLANGWRLKALHREILLSRVYRQSADHREDGAGVDKDARLLWRFPPRRLAAEEIRDTMLSVAGKLRLEPMGGPGFRLYKVMQNNVSSYYPLDAHGPETYRRAVYHQNARASVVDVLNDFDLPDIAFAAPKRASTTTPLQALTLMNHSFTGDMAAALAERVAGADPVGSAYRLAFQREPSATEREAAGRLVSEHGLRALCRALLNANELMYLD